MHIILAFYETDDSFDYNGPLGIMTHHKIAIHGIEFDVIADYFVNFNSIEGFGDFSNLDVKITNPDELLEFIILYWSEKSEFISEYTPDQLRQIIIPPHKYHFIKKISTFLNIEENFKSVIELIIGIIALFVLFYALYVYGATV